MFWTEAVSTACYVLKRVSITNPHNKTPYELLSGKIPNIRHLKPFGCQVTILNTSKHLGKFKGKANDSFLVGYAAHSKAYRVSNLSSKKVEEMLNLRYLEDKPNVQGLGQEWYFDLDYLTDSLGYTCFKTNTPAGTDDTNILTGTQADDSDSECDEQVILVLSFPSNSFSGPTVQDVSAPMENNLDYAKELARLQRQEYEAHSTAAKHGFEFSVDTAALLPQANIEIRRNLVPASGIVPTGGVPAGSNPTGGIVPTGGVLAGSSVPASDVSAGSIPARSVPAGGVLAGSLVSTDSAASNVPAARVFVPAVVPTDSAANSLLPSVHSLGSCAHTTRFPFPSDLGNHQHTAGIFSSSSYDDDFSADVTNLDLNVVVDPVATKRGFEDPYNPKHVYRVVKALYGLHQAPRAWYARLSTFLLKHHYRRGEFEMSAMGELTFFLGLQVKQLSDGIFISQDKYVKDMLKKFDMESVLTATTPYEVPKHKSKDDPDDAVNVHLFRSMIGSFMYLTASRPDIMLQKSNTGGCQFLGRRLISWQCKKQTVVATSSTEAKYVAAASCCGQVRADDLLSTGGCTLHAGSYSFLLLDWFLLVVTTDPSPRPTFDFTAKLFSNTKLNWDGPHMPLLAPMLVVPAGRDAVGATANVATGPGPSSAPQVPPVREHTPVKEPSPVREPTPVREPSPVREPTPVREPSPVREPTPVREPSPRLEQEPTPDSPSPPSLPPSSTTVGPTTFSRPPSPSRHLSVPEDIREGGGDFVSSPQSNEAPQTPAATAAGGAKDSATLTALSFKLDRCLHRVTTLENELGITKKVLGGAVLKLVTRVKRLEGLLQQRKRRLVLSDSEGEDATTKEQEFDLAALHTLASATLGDDSSATAVGPDAETTMPVHSTSTTRRRLRKPFTSSVSAHVSETIPVGVRVPAAATTIPAGSSVDVVVHAAPFSSIPTAADKGKAPMVDDSLLADLLSEQERVLKNLHDSQLGEELAKKIHVEQEAEFARQQEELAQKAQAESVASPTEHAPGMSDQRRRELNAAQFIYTEADWLDLLAKIATNSALSKQLLGDDVTKENMNERLGMLLLSKRRELAEQSRVKPMTKTQQRDYMRDFVKNNSASVYNQDAPPAKRATQVAPLVPAVSLQDPAGVPAAPSIPADVSLPAATSSAPADIPVLAVSIAHAVVSVPAEPMIHPAESHMDDPLTAPEHGSSEPTVAAPPPSSLRHRRKHIAKKRVTPIVDVADAAMIKFDSDSDSDDDPLPYASLLGAVDTLYQSEEPDMFALLLWGDLHVLFQSLDDADALHFWRNQDSWRIHNWRLYPQAQVHVLEMVDGRVIHMFVDVSYPLSVGTLEHMLKHGLEVSKLLVGGDLTMAEQLIGFLKAALLNAKSVD
nr:putative ribonuclease H-like domain-containing protein [Tanacetum cinerariifolium]